MDKLWCARRNIIGNETGKVDKSWMMKASIRNFDCILSMLESHEKSLERLIIKYDMMETLNFLLAPVWGKEWKL